MKVKGRPPTPLRKRSARIILDALDKSPGTFTELQKRTRLSTSTLSEQLEELQNRELIERVYDSEKRKLLIRLSKKALKPKEVFLRELNRMCVKPLTPENSARLRGFLTDRVWSEMLEVADRVKLRDQKMYGNAGEGLCERYLDRLNSNPYKALAGLWIYCAERDFLSERRERLKKGELGPNKRAFLRWQLDKMEKLCKKKEGLIALPFVKGDGVEHEFNELLVEFEKLELSPLSELFRNEVIEEHKNYLESDLIGIPPHARVKVIPSRPHEAILIVKDKRTAKGGDKPEKRPHR